MKKKVLLNVICLKHPKYTGDSDLDIKCKACCAIFLSKLKRKVQ